MIWGNLEFFSSRFFFALTVLKTGEFVTEFTAKNKQSHVEHCECDTFRVSDTLCLQHAYEIKDFGRTIPSSKNL